MSDQTQRNQSEPAQREWTRPDPHYMNSPPFTIARYIVGEEHVFTLWKNGAHVQTERAPGADREARAAAVRVLMARAER